MIENHFLISGGAPFPQANTSPAPPAALKASGELNGLVCKVRQRQTKGFFEGSKRRVLEAYCEALGLWLLLRLRCSQQFNLYRCGSTAGSRNSGVTTACHLHLPVRLHFLVFRGARLEASGWLALLPVRWMDVDTCPLKMELSNIFQCRVHSMIINMYTHAACVDIANKEYQRLSNSPLLQLGLALQPLQVSVRRGQVGH